MRLIFNFSAQIVPFVFEIAAKRPGCEADERGHTMRARARSQQRGSFKGEGYRSKIYLSSQ
ncbi:hypothetical protein [Candidatus Regiella insecticola]|uniref:hypothetical protein n=1 Tax=Candidatus Regiella insecticola TaxID=138073 RepID=UPI0012FEEBA7|nr:hypothetical protein [Candidatus Regiella insecticola]